MGRVQSSLVLNDQMSKVLGRINKAMSLTLNSFEAVQRASGKSFNTANIYAARKEIGAANAALNEMEQSYRDCNNQQDQLNRRIGQGTSAAGGLMSKIKGIAATYLGIKGLGSMVGLSDELAGNKARLELIVDDGGSVDELQQKIYASSQSARASYTDTMSTVAKLGLVAGDAFSNNDQLVKFTELVNKNFVVGGASATEQASAMYQLTQAMGSGRLQGDEYRSIIENAPLLAKSIEDYMRNVQHVDGTMKEWASDGKLTADVIKAAVFKSADEVESRFNSMPKTWAQVWTSMKNRAVVALDPLLQKINQLANDSRIQTFITNLTNSFTWLANIGCLAFDAIINGFFAMQEILSPIMGWLGSEAEIIADNWSQVAPVISAIAAGLAVLAAVVIIYKVAMMIATAVQWLFNTSLFGCPLVWILLIIIAVVAAIYLVVSAINKVTGSSISATGVIMGSLATAGAFIWDLFLGLLELVLGIIELLVNPFISIANFIGNVFRDPVGAVIKLFGSMADAVLKVLQKIASAMDFVFGSNMADTVQGWRDGLDSMVESATQKYGNGKYEEVMSELDLSVEDLGLNRIKYSDAWSAGYQMGENVDSAIADFNLDSIMKGSQNTLAKYDKTSLDPSSGALGDIAKNTGDTAKNTGKSNEELSYLRDIAEREAINRFTTAEIKVDMTGMTNRIDSNMDIDGVISYFTDGVAEALVTASEGVY